MQAILLTILITTMAAYTVAAVVDIFAAKKTYYKLGELANMVLNLHSEVVWLQERIEALEATQAQAPRIVSLVHTKGGPK